MKALGTHNKERFGIAIMDIVVENEIDSVDAILHYCEINDVHMDDVLPMLDDGMREQIRVDAIRSRRVVGLKLTELDL